MKKSKKAFLCALATLTAGGLLVAFSKSNPTLFRTSGSDVGVWNHYTKHQGTEVTIGNSEYWIQCGTNNVVFEKPDATIAEMTVGADTSGYSFHDQRFTDEPKEYLFDKDTNLVGAGTFNVTGLSDYTWGMTVPDSKSLDYKSYSGNVFKHSFPLVNFNYYEEVSMTLKTTIWNEGFKIGFVENVTTYGMSPELGVKDGGMVYLIRINDNTVRMIVNHPNAKMEVYNDFVGEDYVNGTKSIYWYTYATGDVHFEIGSWTPKYSHEHDFEKGTPSDSKIAVVVDTCKICGAQENAALGAIDFTQNCYGASEYSITDSNDITWVMKKETSKLSYKSYETNKLFSLTMPKIDFRDFVSVNITVSSTNWYEGIGFGFTQSEAESKQYHTTFGGEKNNGHLLFRWSGNTLNVEFVFEYVTMTTTVTNKDIINGAAGFVLYQTTYYDRYLDFSNFTFDLKATHVHSYETVSSDSKIAAVKSICSGCGEVQSVTVPTLDFTQNTYGACAYNHTASSDYPTQLMVIEANKLSYKSYELDKVFSFTMPKIDFRDFATVSITVSSTGWYERMSFGFTQEQAATMANHTTYGGSKTGTLSFAWSGDTLNVTFKFEYVTLTSTVTDSNIISGANGFSLFVTSGYDRYLDFSNFALTLKA